MTAAQVAGERAPRPGSGSDVVGSVITMAAVLTAFGLACALRYAVGFSVQNVVLAVVLTLTLARTLARAVHHPAVVAVEVPVLGLAASCAGWLLLHHPVLGQSVLVVALSVGLLARRWGGLVRQAGRLVSLPFLALLVTPVPHVPGVVLPPATQTIIWSPVIGALALVCAGSATWARRRVAALPDPPEAGAARPPATRRRLDAPTRMAVQMAVGLGLALLAGHLLFGERWSWTLLSAFIVASGNRGRGDVAHKAALRVTGAWIGTLGVSIGTTGLPAGNRWLIVAVFALMAVALTLRPRSYAFWALGVTGMVALLHAYYGDTGTAALRERALGVLVGSVIGLAAAWFVLPVRTSDVVRRRIADCLAALTAELAVALDPPPAGDPDAGTGVPAALRALDDVVPALRAHRRLLGRPGVPHALDAVDALHRLAVLPTDERDLRRLRRDVVRVRRAMIGKDDPAPADLPPDLAVVDAVLRTTARTTPVRA